MKELEIKYLKNDASNIDLDLIKKHFPKRYEEALKYKDSLGEKYIEQLREDHSDEIGYVYMIERISNVSFRIIYINKESLQPSHCAIVTYRTGNKPYTTMFSVKLINEFPTHIPPATP